MTEPFPRPWRSQFPESVPLEIADLPDRTLAEQIDRVCEQYAARPAFTNMGTTITFEQVGELSDAVAAYLLNDLGLRRGDRVAIQMPNVLQFPVIEFWVMKAGLVPVNLNPLYTSSPAPRPSSSWRISPTKSPSWSIWSPSTTSS